MTRARAKLALHEAKSAGYADVARNSDWIPIETHSLTFTIDRKAGIACKRTQFPIVQASAITVHKSQGATYASVVYEYSRTHPQKLVYVALSRCTHLGGLYLTNALGDHSFYHREDNPDRAMTDEFRRLENHRLQTVTGRYLDALRREEQRERRRHAFTLALLNVRSLRAHALDVARDPVLQEVDVLCLTETWNNNKQEGGQEARGEGAVGEQGFAPVVRARAVDARSRAGGVDVYYRNVRWRGGMVRHSWSYADTRGEYAGFTAVCDDAYRHGHGQDDGEITVITFYLSPKLNRDAVAEFLELAMNDHRRQQRRQPEQPETQRQRRPIVLVGDFNVDVRKDDWIVRHVRDRYGLDCVYDHNPVNSRQPTTIHGSCIDLVFASSSSSLCVQPLLTDPLTVHFSDHKAVVLVVR